MVKFTTDFNLFRTAATFLGERANYPGKNELVEIVAVSITLTGVVFTINVTSVYDDKRGPTTTRIVGFDQAGNQKFDMILGYPEPAI
jgi:hypothetical protein